MVFLKITLIASYRLKKIKEINHSTRTSLLRRMGVLWLISFGCGISCAVALWWIFICFPLVAAYSAD